MGLSLIAMENTALPCELSMESLSSCGCARPDFRLMEVNAPFVSEQTIKPAARAFADFLLRERSAARMSLASISP